MASKTDRKRKAEDTDDFFCIRAKGQILRVPKNVDDLSDVGVENKVGGEKTQKLLKSKINISDEEEQLHNTQAKKRKKKKVSRREQRKQARVEKKAKKNEFFHKKLKTGTHPAEEYNHVEGEINKSKQDDGPDTKPIKKKRKRKRKNSTQTMKEFEIQRLQDDNKKEEKEIRKLEKLLLINSKKKMPAQFKSDGLDYLLEVCEPLEEGFASENDSEDGYSLLRSKKPTSVQRKTKDRKKKNSMSDEKEDLDDSDFIEEERAADNPKSDDVDASSDEDGYEESDNDSDNIESEDDNDDEGKSDEGESDEGESDGGEQSEEEKEGDGSCASKGVKDNLNSLSQKMGKYVPPQLRNQGPTGTNKEHLNRVRRQLKGLLNKLSEGNLQFICNEIEELFTHNSRNDMNDLLTDLITGSCISPSLMPSKLLMEHCLLIAVLNIHVGMEVGAFFTQKLALLFDSLHRAGKQHGDGKEILNVVSLFAHLYNFKVIDCGLIYDIIRRLSDSFEEQDIELLLLLIKSSGADIRRDDPGSLKDIILQIQAKAGTASDLSNQSRVRFMLEIIANLRNNNLRKIPGYDPSQVEHLRKLLRSVVRESGRGSNSQLKISLKDLLAANTKGRWWIVGSAWSGRNENEARVSSSHQWSTKLLDLARKQRMNTDIRKNVFCVLMTSEDYVEAFENLLRLNLKDVQAREIVHVLTDCCLQEKGYNPFYAYLGQKFCEYNRSYQVTFQYTFWDKFKVITSMTSHSVSNMARLLCHLVSTKALSLSVLKAVNFVDLDKPSIRFFKHFFTHLLTDYPPHIVRDSFERISSIPDLAHLRQSIRIFIRHFVGRKKKLGMRQENTQARSVLDERLEIVYATLQTSDATRL